MDFLEIGKYLIGGIPALIALVWKWKKATKDDTIKNYKDFLVDLEEAHDKLLEAKNEILVITFDNTRLKQINISLNEKIIHLEKQIKEIKAKIAEQKKSP